jgi:hypothetical protein
MALAGSACSRILLKVLGFRQSMGLLISFIAPLAPTKT